MSACVFCAVEGLPSIVWNAHDNDDPAHKRTFPLCCNCHRLYDHGIITTGEIDSAIEDRTQGYVCRDISALYARIAAELAAGLRPGGQVDPAQGWDSRGAAGAGAEGRREWQAQQGREAQQSAVRAPGLPALWAP